MGLNEKRKLKELQDVTLPERQKELAEICGTEIKYEVDWDSLASDLEALNFFDNLSCHRINMAFRALCIDQSAKDAIKESLKTIKLKNVKDKSDVKIAFKNGVLEMQVAYALRTDGMINDTEIKNVVAEGL
jgi:hypothetical protein